MMTPEQYKKQIDDMQDLIIDALGTEAALNEVLKALSYDQKQEVFDWIIRCHDLEVSE